MSTDIRFYHLTRSTLEQALPTMLEKTLERGAKAHVVLGSPERVAAMNDHLWTYDDRGFLPHGSEREGHATDQPVWLSTALDAQNGARYRFFTDGALPQEADDLNGQEVCAILFDGNDAQTLTNARACWKRLQDAGERLTYWQQQERGWKKAAESNPGNDEA